VSGALPVGPTTLGQTLIPEPGDFDADLTAMEPRHVEASCKGRLLVAIALKRVLHVRFWVLRIVWWWISSRELDRDA
jgi:hypothetical protein